MTPFPIDLILHDPWTAQDMAARLRAIRPGDKLALNVLPNTDFDNKALISVLADRRDLDSVTLRLDHNTMTADDIVELASFAQTQDIGFTTDFILKETDDVPGYVLGEAGRLWQITTTTAALHAAGHAVRWLVPLTPGMVYHLEFLGSLASSSGVTLVLLPTSALGDDGADLESDDRLFAWDFVSYRLLGEEINHLARDRISALRRLCSALSDTPAPEADAPWGILDSKTGYSEELRTQGNLSAALLRPSFNDRRGPAAAQVLKTRIADVTDVLGCGVPAHLRACTAPEVRPGGDDPRMPHVLLIGAYGGEHIGDAAILGGVLYRIHKRHGTTRAILMTQRPYHTRHLIPMLDVPVDVEVQEYTPANIRVALSLVDGVVFAGGPLTDLPKQLVRHLETATRAKQRGLPFVMEGIGPGTFVRKPSEFTARRLVKLADRITIRVRDDARREIIRGCDIEIGRDPAFDYLETRAETLTRLPIHEPAQIATLLAGTAGRPVIGINIRPIGHLFTPAEPGRDPAARTRAVEDRCERELALGLMDYARQTGTDPCFLFFPMNAVQFGMSDLRSAWRIMQHLEPGTDFRIWQADASLDGVVALLRRMDTVIAMRFHAAIFALSQGRPVIGIDYRIGKRDKVAAVLTDAGVEENCRRIDELRADWLSERLQAICPARTAERIT
ncbi:polysaccharide pyruvyl transferase family protein [Ruegeria meonggei]|uniref:Polysaccharide pyruvyl transferase n=1 Tax=Ruegeria meonggei TaxID=1446476 RepID=A0A1X7ACT2_9RHOB|nr:polysaccharide pyruvyl transferase family protein [Ruegeria meonggei]SLN75912.1 Polysaccharide pyruvyl transferase [Ruegeria meonggei]